MSIIHAVSEPNRKSPKNLSKFIRDNPGALDGVTAYVRDSASATQVSVFVGDYKYSY
tara:strand:+ start:501 stop:671 length:171 start_codon:yes stop_codon:yes gene_type:complete